MSTPELGRLFATMLENKTPDLMARAISATFNVAGLMNKQATHTATMEQYLLDNRDHLDLESYIRFAEENVARLKNAPGSGGRRGRSRRKSRRRR
jgi:hypothetical protein